MKFTEMPSNSEDETVSKLELDMIDKCNKCDYINCICQNNEKNVKKGEGQSDNSSDAEPQDASEIYFACTTNIYEGKCRLLQFQNAVER